MLIVHNGPCEDALRWTVGAYNDLFKKAANIALDSHHLVQAEKMTALLKKLGQTFDHSKGISILVPVVGHRARNELQPAVKCLSRWNGKKIDLYIENAAKAGKSVKQIGRDLLAKDIKEMRRVYNGTPGYPKVPNAALQDLIKQSKAAFPQLF